MSIVPDLLDQVWPGKISLINCVRSPDEIIFRDELDHLSRRHPSFRLLTLVTDATASGWGVKPA